MVLINNYYELYITIKVTIIEYSWYIVIKAFVDV